MHQGCCPEIVLGLPALVSLDVSARGCSGVEGVALSFNGGKDCTAMLHLISQLYPRHPWPVCYVKSRDPFAELESFVADCEKRHCPGTLWH